MVNFAVFPRIPSIVNGLDGWKKHRLVEMERDKAL